MICVMFLAYSNLYCSRMTLIYFIVLIVQNWLSNTISQGLSKLHNWLAVNKLSLYTNKTNYMVFGKGMVASDLLFLHL